MLKKNKLFGFTLIEVMIAVAVLAILSALAYPSYLQYVNKGRRSDAKAALLQIQLAEEKWRANNTSYTTALSSLGFTATVVGGVNVFYSPDQFYTLSASGASATAYTATATHTGVQTSDTDCKTLSINQDGDQTSTNSSDAASSGCW